MDNSKNPVTDDSSGKITEEILHRGTDSSSTETFSEKKYSAAFKPSFEEANQRAENIRPAWKDHVEAVKQSFEESNQRLEALRLNLEETRAKIEALLLEAKFDKAEGAGAKTETVINNHENIQGFDQSTATLGDLLSEDA